MPVVLVELYNKLDGYRSCVVNSVHDSIVIDVHPDEISEVLTVIDNTNNTLKSIIDNRWRVDFNVPLLLEAKIGANWLDTKDVA